MAMITLSLVGLEVVFLHRNGYDAVFGIRALFIVFITVRADEGLTVQDVCTDLYKDDATLASDETLMLLMPNLANSTVENDQPEILLTYSECIKVKTIFFVLLLKTKVRKWLSILK